MRKPYTMQMHLKSEDEKYSYSAPIDLVPDIELEGFHRFCHRGVPENDLDLMPMDKNSEDDLDLIYDRHGSADLIADCEYIVFPVSKKDDRIPIHRSKK